MNTAWLQSQRAVSSIQREDGNAASGCHSVGYSELFALYVDTAEGCLSSVSPWSRKEEPTRRCERKQLSRAILRPKKKHKIMESH